MNRNIAFIALSLVLLSGLYFGVFHWITADTAMAMKSDRPELEWLRHEYGLNEEQFANIQAKHEAHDIICQQLCKNLIKAQKRLDAVIAEQPGLTTEVEDALAAWAEQRRRCREATIAHMYDVSSVMDQEDAVRYRQRIFHRLIVPNRMPHIGTDGEFLEQRIEHANPDLPGAALLGE